MTNIISLLGVGESSIGERATARRGGEEDADARARQYYPCDGTA